ncbi:MAG: multiheme c-type cytochrome [ANME-2 cluster archaeon]|nr:multiheme c-type cytochrome [ANME-2 cluster archaeon]
MNTSRYIFLLTIGIAVISIGTADALTRSGEWEAEDFSAPQVCGSCHSQNFEEWEGSMHAASNSDPFYQLMFSMASNDTRGTADAYCPRCHSPESSIIGADSKVTPTTDIANASEMGVHCDFCHTIKNMSGIGNGQYISKPGTTKFGPWGDAESEYHGALYSELHTKSEFCGICHYQTHSGNGVVIQNTFQEWLDSPYSKEGTQCQDCHMTPGPGFTQNPGQSTLISPMREHIWTHNTAGGNIFQTSLQSPKHRALAIEMLKNAAKLEVKTKQVTDESISLEVTVSNTGAGHSIPTGSNSLRQVWLEVTATNKDGEVIYRYGTLDSAGSIDPGTTLYGSVYHDESGNVTLKEWEAASLVSDNRIPAGSNIKEDLEIRLPQGNAGPVKVIVRLLYRTAPQGFIDETFGSAAENVPLVEMAKKELTVHEEATGIPGFGMATSVIVMGIVFFLSGRRD